MNPRRLYRCRHDRQLAGVAAGMAEYFEVDPTVVRILWILSVFVGGVTILLYLLLAIVVPLEPLPAAGAPGGGGPAGGDPTAGISGEGPAADPTAAATVQADGPVTGWTTPAGWAAPAAHRHASTPRDGTAGLFLGVLLVVFGTIALANAFMPAWFSAGMLGPAFLVALGVALLVAGTSRRGATDR